MALALGMACLPFSHFTGRRYAESSTTLVFIVARVSLNLAHIKFRLLMGDDNQIPDLHDANEAPQVPGRFTGPLQIAILVVVLLMNDFPEIFPLKARVKKVFPLLPIR